MHKQYVLRQVSEVTRSNNFDSAFDDFIVTAKSVGDKYHTIEELYEHRYELYLALVKIYDNYITPLGRDVKCWKSKLHGDGTMFEGDFILGITATKTNFNPNIEPEIIQITYHLPLKYWDRVNVIILDKAPEWDGHTSKDVLERLRKL